MVVVVEDEGEKEVISDSFYLINNPFGSSVGVERGGGGPREVGHGVDIGRATCARKDTNRFVHTRGHFFID